MNNINKVKLSEIATIQMGYPFRSRLERDNQGNVSVVQMKDIEENGILNTTDLIQVQISEISERHLLKAGDIIFKSRGQTPIATVVDKEIGNVVATAPLLIIKVNSKQALPTYVAWYINQPSSQAYLSSHARGTSVLMVNKEDIDELEIILPSLERQQQIVELSKLAEREQELLGLLAIKRAQYTSQLLMNLAREELKGDNRGK